MTTKPSDAPGLPLLPVPELPVRTSGKPNEGPVTFTTGHHFTAAGGDDARELAEAATALFAAQLSAQLRAARQHPMIICDKTIANVLAYAWIVLETPPRSRAAVTLDAMNTFCRAWAGTYDAVFYCCDRFSQHQQGDPYRAKVLDLQSAADRVVRSTCASVGQNVIDIPPGMTTAERVRWIAARLAKLGITARPTAVGPAR